MNFSYFFDQTTNRIFFHLSKKPGTELMGTAGVPNALVNPLTMGDIYFDVQSTTNNPNVLDAKALIEFHSTKPSPNGQWEAMVPTNIARSYYSKCTDTTYCNCKVPAVDSTKICSQCGNNTGYCGCVKFISLCWWWWAIIGLSFIIIYFLARRRNRKN